LDAEAWLAAERSLLDREEWTPPEARRAAALREQAAAASNTVGAYAERYLSDSDRSLRPSTLRAYRHVLSTRILPEFGDRLLADVKVGEIRAWRDRLNPATPAANAAAYRLLRSLLQAAEEEELIDDPAAEAIFVVQTAEERSCASPAAARTSSTGRWRRT
jgi:hypothetical protein